MPDSLPHLGATRAALRPDHLLQTPDTFVRTPLACLSAGEAILHTAPAAGAAFTMYTAELPTGATLTSAGFDRFLYCLAGSLELHAGKGAFPPTDQTGRTLGPGSYAHLPSTFPHCLTATAPSRAVVIERRHLRPGNTFTSQRTPFLSHERDIAPTHLLGDPAIEVRTLLPVAPDLNFAVNLMTYQPGATLPQVEIHVMEHGLLMLEGAGIYRLGDSWYPVTAGDFIWMAPFCPQWFGALGKAPARYLIYKDANPHPLLR